jgi:nitrate reductase gamma subunit
MLLFASWPFTRLVNAFSAPVAYQRHRDARARDPRRGWERAADRDGRS